MSQTFDFRDSPTNPRNGWIVDASASFSESLDGSASFARFTGRYSTYFSLGKTLLALGARLGYIDAVQGTAGVPIDERFFNGGSTTVRSFYETELSPKDNNNHPIGGLARSIFNVEYDVPIFGDLVGAAFMDAGGTGDNPFDNFATAVGGGRPVQPADRAGASRLRRESCTTQKPKPQRPLPELRLCLLDASLNGRTEHRLEAYAPGTSCLATIVLSPGTKAIRPCCPGSNPGFTPPKPKKARRISAGPSLWNVTTWGALELHQQVRLDNRVSAIPRDRVLLGGGNARNVSCRKPTV